MPPADPPRLYLIDGTSQVYRAYHAIRGLTGPDGRSTNAVFGFVSMLRKLIDEHRPEFIAAAFDLEAPTFRNELATDYKANRPPMPPDLVEQIPLIHEACKALGVPVLTHERYEADDVMGTLARRAAAEGLDVVLVTGDKDFFQLVDDRIRVFNPRDDGTWFDVEGVKAKFGVAPAQVVDVLALMGDAIDNVKGVPGIGEKGARQLIATHGSLDALLAAAATLPQKKYREALTAHAEDALRSRDLVRIHTDVPVSYDLEALRYRGPDRARCYELFSRLAFRSLTAAFAPHSDPTARDYAWVADGSALRDLARSISEAGRVACAVAYDGASARRARVVALAFSTAPGMARLVPVREADTTATPSSGTAGTGGRPAPAASRPAPATTDLLTTLDRDEPPGAPHPADDCWAVLGPLLADEGIAKVGHDLKPLAVILGERGWALRGLADDTLLASYLVDATRPTHDLGDLALTYLDYRAVREADLRGSGTRQQSYASLSDEALAGWLGERADLPARLAPVLRERLADDGLVPVYERLELPLVPVLADLERTGIRVDVDVLRAQSEQLEADLARRRARIVELAGVDFNPNSPKQLGEVLFERLGLPVTKRTGKTRSASTAVDVLEELALTHDIAREILEWRSLAKLKGTYLDALPALVDPSTGRVHTTFNQAVAATGRLSSSDPNLQNIPIRTELGREIRRAFVADPGCVLISADYSQIELRVLAHLSGDPGLIEAFARGEDIHDRTARAVFGPDSGLDPYELRRRAKIINYALIYGKTAFSLARDLGVSQQAAQAFIDAYFARFPGVRTFIDATLARARETGVVATLEGRRRPVPELTSPNAQVRAAAERVAVNMPVQGTAADILKRAMIDLHGALAPLAAGPAWQARMVLTVHDELLFEVRRERADEVAALVKERMQQAASLRVPLIVEVGIGENWKDAKR